MADYNSPYTGSEIDAAIAKADKISEYIDLYNGAPTNAGVALSSLAVNPKTGDRSGLYYIIFSIDAVDLSSPTTNTQLSVMYISADAGTSSGTSVVGMGTTDIYSGKAKYNIGAGGADGKIHAYYYSHPFSSGSATSTEYYIHRIVRIQEAV